MLNCCILVYISKNFCSRMELYSTCELWISNGNRMNSRNSCCFQQPQIAIDIALHEGGCGWKLKNFNYTKGGKILLVIKILKEKFFDIWIGYNSPL